MSLIDDFESLMRSGLRAERQARWEQACAQYSAAIRLLPERAITYLYLGCALGRWGYTDAAAQVLSLGYDRNANLLSVWRSPRTDRAVAERSRYADTLFRKMLSAQHVRSVQAYESETGCGELPRVRAAIWCQTHDRPYSYQHPQQRPWLLYLPALEPRTWFEVEQVWWSEPLLARFPAIADEVEAALAELDEEPQPYLAAGAPPPPGLRDLHGSRRWSSIHVYREGKPGTDGVLSAFPEVRDAIDALDCVRLDGNPMELVISRLAPNTRIPPHYGLANTRMIVHLPIRVPEGCWLRVGGEKRVSTAGKLLAFDDGFLHEAGNDSSELRVHLVFHAWRPDLGDHEKAALTRCVEDRHRWNLARGVPAVGGGYHS